MRAAHRLGTGLFGAALLVAGAAAMGGCGKSAPPAPGDPARGEPTYAQYCLPCHQADGSGVPPGGGRPLAASFADPQGPLAKGNEELLQAIQLGKVGAIGSMPGWRGILTAQQQRDVLAFLRQRFVPPLTDAP